MNTLKAAILATATVAALFSAAMAQARPGWGPSWGGGYGSRWDGGWNDPLMGGPVGAPISSSRTKDSREGRVEVSRFVAQGPEAADLGHGAVSVRSDSGEGQWVPGPQRAAYEAAIVDALVGAGYDTQRKEDGGQVAELKISRQVLTPAEEKRNPVSGTAAVGVSNRGSAYGLALNVDLTKPRSALVGTRLDTRIVDKASGKVLWEGYATIATREGDDDWPDYRIAGKLAEALFDGFPKADPVGLNAPQG